MDDRDLLAEIEDLLRTVPSQQYGWHNAEAIDWLGRAMATLQSAGGGMIEASAAIDSSMDTHSNTGEKGRKKVLLLIQSTRHRLRMNTVGPLSLAVDKGMVHDYFDGVRRLIEEAQTDILFIDPFLDADFVDKYLGFVRPTVSVRLLARERVSMLVPAVSTYAQQHGLKCEIRKGSNFHDRLLFIDGKRGFHSGASFKDGGIRTPALLLEISDTFTQVKKIYEDIWSSSPQP